MQGPGEGLGEGGLQGGTDYLLVSQLANAEELELPPGAFFS